MVRFSDDVGVPFPFTPLLGALDSIVVLAITYVAGVATPLGALLAGGWGVLTVALEEVSPGSTDSRLAVNGILLVIAAIRLPSGILGSRRSR
jgi:ABC-type branched-subunit amino acid transport system permease subunit